jgi:hypothetical protein
VEGDGGYLLTPFCAFDAAEPIAETLQVGKLQGTKFGADLKDRQSSVAGQKLNYRV